MTQAERDACDMAAYFEDSGNVARTVAECQTYIEQQYWTAEHAAEVMREYNKIVNEESSQ